MVSIHLINFEHIVLFMELGYGLMCYARLAIRWFSIYVGDINICLFYSVANVVFVNRVDSVSWIVWLVL